MFRRKRSTSATTTTTSTLPATSSSSSTTTTTTTPILSSSSSSYVTSSNFIILLLLYIIFFQYSVIQTKDAAIFTILSSSSSSSSSNHHDLLTNRHSFNSRQYQLYQNFRRQQQQQQRYNTNSSTTNTGGGVGIFPRHPPPRTTTTTTTTAVVWQPHTTTILRKQQISYPIFVPSLPKSGTTSIWKYFKCGHQAACHNWIQKVPPPTAATTKPKSTLLGKCIQDNIQNVRPAFADCGPYDVFTDSGYLNYDHDTGEQCFYPSIDGLDAIYESYPTMTFVNVVRNTEAWYHSIRTWSSASLFVRLRLCNATGFPNGQSTREDIMQMYDNFNQMIRQFVKDRPSITYIEVQLESNATGKLLQEATGIDAACWKVCRPQDRHCQGDEPAHHHGHHQRPHPSSPPDAPRSDTEQAVQSIKETAMKEEGGNGDGDDGEGGDDGEEGEDNSGNDDNDEGIPDSGSG